MEVCGICLDNSVDLSLVALQSCSDSHGFCEHCLSEYFEIEVEKGVTSIRCPQFKCPANATKADIKCYTRKEFYILFKAYKARSKPTHRECGFCIARLRFKGEAELKCKYGVISCYVHGSAHPYESCVNFVYRTEQSGLCEELIRKTTRKCPRCRVNTERNGGCRSMVSCVLLVTFVVAVFVDDNLSIIVRSVLYVERTGSGHWVVLL